MSQNIEFWKISAGKLQQSSCAIRVEAQIVFDILR